MRAYLQAVAVAACIALFVACSEAGSGVAPTGDAGAPDVSVPSVDGSSPDELPDGGPAAGCDDGNPCTLDRAENGRCVHEPAPEGMVCNDGLRCTGDDRCRSGECRGDDLTPHVVKRGTAIGFGAPPNEDGMPVVGLNEPITDTQVLFAETLGIGQLALSLVESTATGLVRLDTRKVDVGLEHYFHSRDWSVRLATFFVPLGGGRVVLVASRQRIELFEITGGKIESRAIRSLPLNDNSIIAGIGRGSRFYTCSPHALQTWEIDGAGAIQLLGTFFPPHDCGGLSLSADGTELLIASTEGMDRVDVTDPRVIVHRPSFAVGREFWRVDANADFIVGQRQGWYGEIADIEVYRRVDLEADPSAAPAVTFAGVENIPGHLPVGFALLDGDAIAVEWWRNDGTETTYTTEVHALPGNGPVLRSFVHRRVRDDRLSLTPVAIARRGRQLVVPPWRTVLRDDPDQGELTPLAAQEQAGFESITPRDATVVSALSGLSLHEVDLSNPDAPAVSSAPLPVDVGFFRWEPNGRDTLAAPISLPAGPIAAYRDATPASCFRRETTGALALAGSVIVPGEGLTADLGRAMLHVAEDGPGGLYRVRWYEAPSSCEGQTLAPAIDGRVDVSDDTRQRTSWAFGGDASGVPSVVIAEVRRFGVSFTMTIAWLERRKSGDWRVAARVALDDVLAFAHTVHVHGDRAVIHDGRRMIVVRRQGANLVLAANREIQDGNDLEELAHILRFDGELVYVATRRHPMGVIVLRARDLERLARFETHGLARSVAEVGDALVFGSANALDVADLVCPR